MFGCATQDPLEFTFGATDIHFITPTHSNALFFLLYALFTVNCSWPISDKKILPLLHRVRSHSFQGFKNERYRTNIRGPKTLFTFESTFSWMHFIRNNCCWKNKTTKNNRNETVHHFNISRTISRSHNYFSPQAFNSLSLFSTHTMRKFPEYFNVIHLLCTTTNITVFLFSLFGSWY